MAFVLARGTLEMVDVKRKAPGLMKEGQRRRVRLTATNRGLRRRYFFTLSDELPDGLEATDESKGEALVPSLAAEEEFVFEYPLQANRRGVYRLGPATLEHTDLIGMFNFRRKAGEADELVVHPTPERIPNIWSLATSLRAPERPRRRFKGEGTEFYGTRPFVPGDDLRRVDWSATARRGQLIVREYERAEATDAVLIIDLSASVHRGEGDDHTLERAVKLAASAQEQLLDRGSSVGLIAVGEENFSVPSSPAPAQRSKLLDALARVQADGREELAAVIEGYGAYLPSGGMVIVISPRLDAKTLPIAGRLLERGHTVSWMIVEGPEDEESRRDELSAMQLAARMTDRGIDSWTVAPKHDLAISMRRARRE